MIRYRIFIILATLIAPSQERSHAIVPIEPSCACNVAIALARGEETKTHTSESGQSIVPLACASEPHPDTLTVPNGRAHISATRTAANIMLCAVAATAFLVVGYTPQVPLSRPQQLQAAEPAYSSTACSEK